MSNSPRRKAIKRRNRYLAERRRFRRLYETVPTFRELIDRIHREYEDERYRLIMDGDPTARPTTFGDPELDALWRSRA